MIRKALFSVCIFLCFYIGYTFFFEYKSSEVKKRAGVNPLSEDFKASSSQDFLADIFPEGKRYDSFIFFFLGSKLIDFTIKCEGWDFLYYSTTMSSNRYFFGNNFHKFNLMDMARHYKPEYNGIEPNPWDTILPLFTNNASTEYIHTALRAILCTESYSWNITYSFILKNTGTGPGSDGSDETVFVISVSVAASSVHVCGLHIAYDSSGIVKPTQYYDVDEPEVYPMNNNFGAHVFITVMTSNRHGWEEDIKSLKKLHKKFKWLLFEKNIVQNPNCHLLRYCLETFANSEMNISADSAFIFLMGHGGTDLYGNEYICTADGDKFFYKQEIHRIFNNTDCPSLAGKPKVFVIQACRGPGEISCSQHAQGASDFVVDHGEDSDTTLAALEQDAINVTPDAKIPFTDYVFAYASQPGKESYRDIHAGSWFIQNLVDVFTAKARERHVIDMLTTVRRNLWNQHKKELPVAENGLLFDFYLFSQGGKKKIADDLRMKFGFDTVHLMLVEVLLHELLFFAPLLSLLFHDVQAPYWHQTIRKALHLETG